MRKLSSLCFAAALSGVMALAWPPKVARATEVGSSRTAGVGFAVGEPTGIVGKLFLSRENAIDAGVSFYTTWAQCRDGAGNWHSCSNHTSLSLNADYLWQFPLVRGQVNLDWHIGAGARVWIFGSDGNGDSSFLAAVRAPFGLDLTFANPSFVEVFLEITPALYLIPAAGFGIEPCLGVRFYP